MSVNGNRRKSEQLGMPHGTANNRLRKMVVLSLLQQLGQDVCYRCHKNIETVAELSMEHKIAWLDFDAKLFWDLDNVAFSHLSCNSRAANRVNTWKLAGIAQRKVGPEGTSWCSACKHFLPVADFNRNSSKWDGRDSLCRACQKSRR